MEENVDQRAQKLAFLRKPFPDNQIGKLAKGSKAQMQCDAKEKKHCTICGGFHHPKLVHLDYVGHAALTDRLLDVDPFWTWEPLAITDKGLPAFDDGGGLWIRLTVCGHSRIGYGNAEPSQYKEVGAREKEVIGDALRNAAMRFGAALELWHKGSLHAEPEPTETTESTEEDVPLYTSEKHAEKFTDGTIRGWQGLIDTDKDLNTFWDRYEQDVITDLGEKKAKMVKAYWESKAIK